MKVILCVITYDRSKVFRECLQHNIEFLENIGLQVEVITLHNDGNYKDKKFVEDLISGVCLMPAANLGVAGGRNLIIAEMKKRDLVDAPAIFIDDDAIINSLPISVLSEPSSDIVACKSLNKSLSTRFHELPYAVDDNTKEIYTSNFIGVSHIFMPRFLRSNLNYDIRFQYGFEEMYLSLLALSYGYSIQYNSKYSVIHYKSPSGRLNNKTLIYERLKNKFIIANTFFTWPRSTIYKIINLLVCVIRSPQVLRELSSVMKDSKLKTHEVSYTRKQKLLSVLKEHNFPLWR